MFEGTAGRASVVAATDSTDCACTGTGLTRCPFTGLEVTTMLRTSLPDRVSGRTTLVNRCPVSGGAAQPETAIPARTSVEQNRAKMFREFPGRYQAIWEVWRKPNVIIS